MNQNTDDPHQAHQRTDDGSRPLPTTVARFLAGGGRWLLNYSSTLLVASVITGGPQAGVGRALTLMTLSAGLTTLGHWARRRGRTRSRTMTNASLPRLSPSVRLATDPAAPSIARPRAVRRPGDVTTLYHLKVLPGTGRVELTPLIEILHVGQPPESPCSAPPSLLRTDEELVG